jgi:membrane-associated HD superfamily phosphohydrolase
MVCRLTLFQMVPYNLCELDYNCVRPVRPTVVAIMLCVVVVKSITHLSSAVVHGLCLLIVCQKINRL